MKTALAIAVYALAAFGFLSLSYAAWNLYAFLFLPWGI